MRVVACNFGSERKTNHVIRKAEKYLKMLNVDGDFTLRIYANNRIENMGEFEVPEHRRIDDKLVNDLTVLLNPKFLKTRYSFLRTLFHELVHVKQYVFGELRHVRWNYNCYLKKMWNGEAVEADYLDEPWEKEAFRMEDEYWKAGKL